MTAARGLRIGVRVSTRTSGGGRVFAAELVNALSRAPGCEQVTVFLLGAEGAGLSFTDGVAVVHVHGASSPLLRRTLGNRALRAAAKSYHLDALVCPGTELAKIEHVPTILWPLTVAPFEREALELLGTTPLRRLKWSALRIAIRRACRSADGLVFSSHYARAVHGWGTAPGPTAPSRVIYPAPSLGQCVQPDGRAAGVGDLPKDFILFVSHLYPYKMVVELIRGYAQCTEDPAFGQDLVLAGSAVDESYHTRVRSVVAELGLANRVHLLGSVDKEALAYLYEQAGVFVFPSISENAGSYALIDAFEYGKPVVCSSMSSMPEICQGSAYYFDPRDPGHIAEQLRAVVIDPHLRANMARRSRDRADAFPSWDAIAERLVSFSTELVT